MCGEGVIARIMDHPPFKTSKQNAVFQIEQSMNMSIVEASVIARQLGTGQRRSMRSFKAVR